MFTFKDIYPHVYEGVPHCSSESCRQYDGKRCELIGQRPSSICEPAVEQLFQIATRAASPPVPPTAPSSLVEINGYHIDPEHVILVGPYGGGDSHRHEYHKVDVWIAGAGTPMQLSVYGDLYDAFVAAVQAAKAAKASKPR